MSDLEREIDRLFQLPIAEFTAARNALAKRAGDRRDEVMELAKPNAAAWAVNQVYWHARDVYDAVIDAASALKAVHRDMLSGKAADLRGAEAAHRDAVKAAADKARELLKDAGDAATAATLVSINETLQALPNQDAAPGRLMRPLKPLGFEALAGMVAGLPKRPPGRIVPFPPKPAPKARARAGDDQDARKREAEERRRIEEARKREIAAAERELRAAENAEKKARGELKDAERALADAEREHERARAALEKAEARADQSRDAARKAQRAAEEAEAERERLARRLRSLDT